MDPNRTIFVAIIQISGFADCAEIPTSVEVFPNSLGRVACLIQTSLPVAITKWYLQGPFLPAQSLGGASLPSETPRGPVSASLTDIT